MNMSLFQIIAAVVMMGAAFGLVVAVRRYRVAQSERRMTGMLERIGLDPAIVTSGATQAIMKDIRRRCRSCASEDVCERWLASEYGGANTFCPNATVLEALKKTISAAG